MVYAMWRKASGTIEALRRDERGLGTLEIVMIAAVLVAIVLVFKDQIIGFIETLMDKVSGKSDELFE